jgi:predicted LPLAT superfamily acyltransferase
MTFSDLVRPTDYQTVRQSWFPSDGALLWFMRKHLAELEACRAVVRVNRRKLINAPVFDEFVMMHAEG